MEAKHIVLPTSHILMVKPARFGINADTLEDNAFIHSAVDESAAIHERAADEFDRMVQALRERGIHVEVFEDVDGAGSPDAVFPNNWVSFHADGTVVLYPMMSPIRRRERRADILQRLKERYDIRRTIHLEHFERAEKYLEGTGSMVLDRTNKIAFASISRRTHPDVLRYFAEIMGYEMQLFRAQDRQGRPIYHTNVLMAVGSDFVVVCSQCIVDRKERDRILARIEQTGREVVDIDFDQLERFVGNVIELRSTDGTHHLVLSQTALRHLKPVQREVFERRGRQLLPVDIGTIEAVGGGSARCMIAEIFCPPTI